MKGTKRQGRALHLKAGEVEMRKIVTVAAVLATTVSVAQAQRCQVEIENPAQRDLLARTIRLRGMICGSVVQATQCPDNPDKGRPIVVLCNVQGMKDAGGAMFKFYWVTIYQSGQSLVEDMAKLPLEELERRAKP